jgi:uncharacterized membrane protein YdjX (TVP38/TMEM64 family)
LITGRATDFAQLLVGAAMALALALVVLFTTHDVLVEHQETLSPWAKRHRLDISAGCAVAVVAGAFFVMVPTS